MDDKKWWIPYIVSGITLLIGSFFDYQIDAYLFDPNNIIGIIMQCYVPFFFIAALALVFTLLKRVQGKWLYIFLETGVSMYAVAEVAKYHLELKEHVLLIVFLGILLLAVCNFIVYRMKIERLKRMEKKAIFFACVFITAIVIGGGLKMIWGRVRFRELDSALQFRAWFLPQGINGHHSFPSGHTITLSTILCLLVISKDCPKQRTPWYIVFAVYAFIIIMTISRMIMGAHYLSDVSAGFMITYTVFLWYREYFYRKRYL